VVLIDLVFLPVGQRIVALIFPMLIMGLPVAVMALVPLGKRSVLNLVVVHIGRNGGDLCPCVWLNLDDYFFLTAIGLNFCFNEIRFFYACNTC
jgi:hypothetical protein